ncbi:MAG: 3-deoxy-D-arabino-heptulosonate 7-phosphate synthase [SAR324 cluster bacterium]|nr:3-deoxy-D-arabino-heptulosonate 7-phosphate synthase [SAR324 cluster bacterium]
MLERDEMIIPKEPRLTSQEESELEEITGEFDIHLQKIEGEHQTVYAMVGDERHELLINRLEGLEYIARVDTIQQPYKLMAKDSELANHTVRVNGTEIGTGFTIIAGQCTIDPKNPNFFLETAEAVKEAGGDILRGGVWKPRTSPHSYQGDVKALDILMEAKARTGLPVDTEVMDAEHVSLALDAGVDMFQVGARNALNYGLLKEIGRQINGRSTCVLLKRSMHMGKIEEFILAAEYIAAQGNPNIILCPRGTTPTMDGYRNHPDESITVLLKERTWAPVIVDPCHSVGKAIYVPFAAMAAASYGADGLIIETHVDPIHGIGDDPKQAVSPEVLARVIRDTKAIHEMQLGHTRHLAHKA